MSASILPQQMTAADLLKAMERLGLNRRQLAAALGRDERTIRRWLKSRPPPIAALAIARLLEPRK